MTEDAVLKLVGSDGTTLPTTVDEMLDHVVAKLKIVKPTTLLIAWETGDGAIAYGTFPRSDLLAQGFIREMHDQFFGGDGSA